MKKILLLTALISISCSMLASLVPGTVYRIVPTSNANAALDVLNSSTGSQADVAVWTYTNVPSQQWECVANADGTYSFRNIYSSQYLFRKGSVSTTASLSIYGKTVTSLSKWEIEEADDAPNTYYIAQSSQNVSYYVGSASTTDGAKPTLQAATKGLQQQWRFVAVDPITAWTAATRDRMAEGWMQQYVRNETTSTAYFGNCKGGWGLAEMLEILLDGYEATGNQRYLDLFKKGFRVHTNGAGTNWTGGGNNYDWFGYDFNDDVMWMIIASIRAYHLTGQTYYRTLAKNNFDNIYKRAYIPEIGSLRWAERSGDKYGTNSCINGPAMVAACYLADALGDESYYKKAKDIYEVERKYLMNTTTGQVYDAIVWDPATSSVKSTNQWASTYNQGTVLGAAVMLYDHYGDQTYKQDALRIAAYTKSNLCDNDHIIKVCQTQDGTYSTLKGILMRYLRRFTIDLQRTSDVAWMQDNAFRAFNNMNSKDVCWSAWLTRSTEDFSCEYGNATHSYRDEASGPMTALSAAFNAPLSTQTVMRSAYDTIEAEDFSSLRGAYVVAGTAGDNKAEVTNLANGNYTEYSNVRFGYTPAQSVIVRVSQLLKDGVAASLEIRLDSIDGKLVANAEIPATPGWKDLSVKLSEPVTGTHNVYLVCKRKTGVAANGYYNIDRFVFSQDETTGIDDVAEGALSLTYTQGAISLSTPAAATIHIYNAAGQLAMRQQLAAGSHTVALPELAPGVYMAKVEAAGESRTLKLLIR